jgi:L-threonylcarbamoyladenylate synthase
MTTPILATPCDAIPDDAIRRACEILRAGGLVALPTETVYGLAANALDPRAVLTIFTAKGRPSHNPLIVHVADTAAARALTTHWPEVADQLSACFWPGPLTLVLPRAPIIPDEVTGGGATVAVRIPAHPVARRVLTEVGVPLAAPSANRSNRLSPTRADHVFRDLDGRIDLILDAGPTTGGIESTVLDLTTHPPRLLRPGLITRAVLESVVGPVDSPPSPPDATDQPLPSPGMMTRHYAPRTSLECTTDVGRVTELLRQGRRVGWVTYQRDLIAEMPDLITVEMPNDPVEYAARLYDVLHQLDALHRDRIVVQWPPEGDDWLGVRDRLRRAAEVLRLSPSPPKRGRGAGGEGDKSASG